MLDTWAILRGPGGTSEAALAWAGTRLTSTKSADERSGEPSGEPFFESDSYYYD